MQLRRIELPAWLTSGRARWYVGAAVVAGLLVVLLVVMLIPADVEPPRERRYRDITACLLTDDEGLVGRAAAVWAGMQDASLETQVKVQYLSIPREQTPQNAALYLNGMGQSGCVMVFAVGETPVAGLADSATRFPNVRFVAVGGDVGAIANVSSVEFSSNDALRANVKAILTDAVGSKGTS